MPAHSKYQTQWAAQFAVASELCKHNYKVALTHGNHPGADLMVFGPKGTAFLVEVKGLYKENYWQVRPWPPKREDPDLFFVFAFVPKDAKNRFFVLTRDQCLKEAGAHRRKCQTGRIKKGLPVDDERYRWGVPWRLVAGHENRWDYLPDWE